MSDILDYHFEDFLHDLGALLPEKEPTPAAKDSFLDGPVDPETYEDTILRANDILLKTETPVFAKPLYEIKAAPHRPKVDDSNWHFPISAFGPDYWARFPSVLKPNAVNTPPPHPELTYPQAPVYTLLTNDWRFPQGCAYFAPYYSSNKDAERTSLLHTINPPGVAPQKTRDHHESQESGEYS
ncbi:hypothetical protein BDZ89DRAFT_1127034 [Hymenopellis radicata]|nr:hypothetical protein BDZ89DRAFT_1127034 [Hymenopellis radicata]